ncbi:MAG: hypothetical protein OEY59_12850 [Deltaproteobacteria bacterium]|nr:hypothetical protein [Deltaproteobacteria bacterium]
MSVDKDLFDKETLKQALLSGTLMVAIDQDFNKNEWETCKTFLDQYWKDEYGDSQELFKEVLEELKYILLSGTRIREESDSLAEELSKSATPEQQKTILDFIKTVMEADGHLAWKESDLFQRFAKKFNE